jgi:hypothetical protein
VLIDGNFVWSEKVAGNVVVFMGSRLQGTAALHLIMAIETKQLQVYSFACLGIPLRDAQLSECAKLSIY